MIILPSSISFHSFVAVYCQIYNIWLSLSLCSILIHAFILISLLSLGWMKFIFWNIPWEWLMGEQFPEILYMSPFYASLLEKKNWLFIKFLVHNSISWVFFFFLMLIPFSSISDCLQTHVLEHGQWLDGICCLYFHLKENWIEDTLSLLCMLITHIFSFIFHSFLGGVTEDML